MKSFFLIPLLILLLFISCKAQKHNSLENTYTFKHKGTLYELIKDKKTWEEAAAYAKTRNAYLAVISSEKENTEIFNQLQKANINLNETVALDGGGASYIWIGGNDISSEGVWIWDGNNNGSGEQFWQGLADGKPINNLYNNFGKEPDNYGTGQDCLAIGLTEWPKGNGSLGSAGQWNDVNHTNKLYFLLEYRN